MSPWPINAEMRVVHFTHASSSTCTDVKSNRKKTDETHQTPLHAHAQRARRVEQHRVLPRDTTMGIMGATTTEQFPPSPGPLTAGRLVEQEQPREVYGLDRYAQPLRLAAADTPPRLVPDRGLQDACLAPCV